MSCAVGRIQALLTITALTAACREQAPQCPIPPVAPAWAGKATGAWSSDPPTRFVPRDFDREEEAARLEERKRTLARQEPVALSHAVLESARTRMTAAVRSPADLWRVLTSPDTAYLDRYVAADLGGEMMPLDCLPRLIKAIVLLREEEWLHRWGLRFDPMTHWSMEFGEWRNRIHYVLETMPVERRERNILGHAWPVPDRLGTYSPRTWDEKTDAPWPWQVQRTLERLFYAMGPGGRAPDAPPEWFAAADAWIDAVRAVPYTTETEVLLVIQALSQIGDYRSMPAIARLRSISLDPRFPKMAGSVAWWRFCEDPEAQEIMQVLILEVLRSGRSPRIKQRAAHIIRYLRNPVQPHERIRSIPDAIATSAPVESRPTFRLPPPHSVILQLCEMGLDPSTGSERDRLYNYIRGACDGMDDPPFVPDRSIDMEDAASHLARLQAWFAIHEAALRRAAAREKPRLDAIRAQLVALEAKTAR